MEGGFPKIVAASGAAANIIASDVHACAAVVHVLDMVLLPPGVAPILTAPAALAGPVVQAASLPAAVPPAVAPVLLPRAGGMAPAGSEAAGR